MLELDLMCTVCYDSQVYCEIDMGKTISVLNAIGKYALHRVQPNNFRNKMFQSRKLSYYALVLLFFQFHAKLQHK